MQTVALDEQEFERVFVAPMHDVTESGDAPVDIWPYVSSIPEVELRGLTIHDGVVEYVYRSGDARFDHVLIPTSAANVFLVIVVARSTEAIHGHHVLDLNPKYGLHA